MTDGLRPAPARTSAHHVIEARLRELSAMVRAQRARRRLTMRQAAVEADMGFATFGRIERFEGGGSRLPDIVNLLLILKWLDVPPAWCLGLDAGDPEALYRKGWDDCAAKVRAAAERHGDA